MSLQVPSFPNPYSTVALTDAYAWISCLNIDFVSMTGRVEVRVNADATSADNGLPAISVISYSINAVASQGPQGATSILPPLTQVLSDNQAAFDSIRTYLYEKIAADPQFSGATQVD
jgi:hypothetical protein